MLLVKEPEEGCRGTRVTSRVMTVVGAAVGTVVVGVGAGVFVVSIIVGEVVEAGVVSEGTIFVAAGVTVVLVAGMVFAPGRGVADGDCGRGNLSPAPAVPANGVPVICAKCGNRRIAATPRRIIPAIKITRTGIAKTGEGPASGTGSGSGDPHEVQNF